MSVCSSPTNPVTEDFDVVIRLGRPDEPYLVCRRLMSTTGQLYVAAERAAELELDDPDAVERLGRIVLHHSGMPRWVFTSETGVVHEMQSKPLVVVEDPLVAIRVLETGVGVAMLPDHLGDPLVAQNRAVPVLPSFRGPTVDVYVVLPPRRGRNPAVRAFLDELEAQATTLYPSTL